MDAEVIQRTLDGRLKVSPDGTFRESDRYLLIGREEAGRPDPVQAAWLYAQMVRWGQANYSPEALAAAKKVFRPDLYDAALGSPAGASGGVPDGIGAFTGGNFDDDAIASYLASLVIKRRPA